MKYFIQDKRQIVGNCMVLWRVDGKGYTTDLGKAWLVDGDWKGRDTDVLWPEATLRDIARLRVDVQVLPDREQIKHLLPGWSGAV